MLGSKLNRVSKRDPWTKWQPYYRRHFIVDFIRWPWYFYLNIIVQRVQSSTIRQATSRYLNQQWHGGFLAIVFTASSMAYTYVSIGFTVLQIEVTTGHVPTGIRTWTWCHCCGCRCSSEWRHNERYGVSNHRHLDCLLNLLFRCRSKKTPKLRVTGLCEGNSPVTGEFPSQRASNADKVSIWYVTTSCTVWCWAMSRHWNDHNNAKFLWSLCGYWRFWMCFYIIWHRNFTVLRL